MCRPDTHAFMAMSHNKKRLKGFVERLQVLRRHFLQCDELVVEALPRFSSDQVAKDDILDALAAAVTGMCGNSHFVTFPEEPERDANGLSMEMVYYAQN